MAIGILYRDELTEYDFGPGHPFRRDRYTHFMQYLKANLPEDDNYRILQAEPASEEDLLLICQKEYIDFTREYFKAANLGLEYPGNFSRFHSGDNMPIGRPGKLEEAARLVIGQARMACDLVEQGKYQKVVSIGGGLHHAKRAYGEGFCLYNDVAFCGLYLLKQYRRQRVLILDTDAHAGNGTCEYFYEDPRVLFIDLHQDPMSLYPGTGFASDIGAGKGKGFTVNIPLPPGAGDDCYKFVFESLVEPLVAEFKPEIIVRNGGSDPHFSDGLANLGLSVKGFRMIGEKVRQMAEVCNGREIDLIASGYNDTVLAPSWLSLVSGLAGFNAGVEKPEQVPALFQSERVLALTARVVDEVKANLASYWQSMR